MNMHNHTVFGADDEEEHVHGPNCNHDHDHHHHHHHVETLHNPMRNVGRNDDCPCGSGKKYKKCCLKGG